MLKIISKQGALKAFYYLMSVDGVTSFEEDRFQEIGEELLGSEFETCKDELVSFCEGHLDSISVDDERYDVIQEGIDLVLNDTVTDVNDGVVPRLLVWNMLSLAHCDDDYSENENRLIAHVARVLSIDKSVFVEMKQLISTADSVRKEQEQLELSDRPYSEIRPLVDEVEKRKNTIVEAAKALIEDDLLFAELPSTQSVEKKENVILNVGKKFGESMAAGGKKVGESVAPVAKDLGAKAVTGAAGIKDGAGKLFSKMKDATKKTSVVLPSKYEKIQKKLPSDMGLPKDAVAYGMANENTNALLICFQVSEESSMDFDDPEGIINSLHEDMDEHAGIIEVKSGVTKNGGKYIYHIMKHATSPENELPIGNTYTINLNIQIGNTIQFVNGSFEECGTTGLRDSMVFAILRNENLVKEDFEGWSADPYDKEYQKGFLMNLSEDAKFDEMFSSHPLSEVRRLAGFIIGTN